MKNEGESVGSNAGFLPDAGSGDMAVIGEGAQNEARVSIQTLQSIYNELTGKSEDISKSYDHPFQVTLQDFDQLDIRFDQICEQYNIKSKNCSVKVYFINDTQQTFSSFPLFKAFNAGSISAVESVLITYNILIILPKVLKPQCFTVTVRVASRIAILKKIRDGVSNLPRVILRAVGGTTAVVTVKYVDFAVAKTMLNVADEWFGSLRRARSSYAMSLFRGRSDLLPPIARNLAGTLVSLWVFREIPRFVPNTASLLQLAQFLLGAFVGIFAAYQLAHLLGRAAEESVDDWNEISFVSLTAGDKKEIADAEEGNKKSIYSALLKLAGSLLVSVAAKLIISAIDR